MLITSPWFPETVDMYFEGKMEATFQQSLDYLMERGLVKADEGERLICTLPA